MVSATTSLSSSQLKFLENNFVVYNPDSKRCYKDFSRLPKCQVILIGETHYTHVLHKLQGLFLKQIPPKDKSCCVLKESLSVGEKFKASQMPFWNDVPDHIEMLGSDIRFKITSKDYIEWKKIEHELRVIDLEFKKALEDYNRKTASIVNTSFDSDHIKENECLLITQEVSKQLDIDDTDIKRISAKRDALIEKLDKLLLSFQEIERGLVKSNEGLCNEILKAIKIFPLVIGIWGEGHWFQGEKLFKKLGQAKVEFVVIIPNNEINLQVKDELVWRTRKMKTLTLNLKTEEITKRDGNKSTLVSTHMSAIITEPFNEFFLPQIQDILRRDELLLPENPCIEVDRDNLSLFAKEDRIVIPAYRPIKFVGFNSLDYEYFQEACVRQQANRFHFLLPCLNNMLVFIQKSVDSLKANFTDVSFTYENQLPVVSLISSTRIEIGFERDVIKCTADHLLSEMHRKGIQEFKVEPNRELHFLFDKDEELSKTVDTWLSGKTPRINLEVELSGDISFRKEDKNGIPHSVVLVTKNDEGFKISLKKKKVGLDKSESKDDS